MPRYFLGLLLGSFYLSAVAALDFDQREHIFIVGSSTTFPFVSAVAERFTRSTGFTSPTVESTGTGGGFKLFCSGIGARTPDVTMASRPIKPSELARCRNNHVTEIVKLKFGYDGIAIANAAGQAQFQLSRKDLYLALARWVPDVNRTSEMIKNPYTHWQQINRQLPNQPILVYGPPPTSGTRDALLEQVLEIGCGMFPTSTKHKRGVPEELRRVCHALREDGAYVNAGENDMRLVRKLIAEPKAVGILGYNFLDRNRSRLQAATIEGIAPEFEAIESGRYPVSRPLYLYIKQAHIRLVPGFQAFLDALTDDAAWGPEGYLSDKGLIPLSDAERPAWRAKAVLTNKTE